MGWSLQEKRPTPINPSPYVNPSFALTWQSTQAASSAARACAAMGARAGGVFLPRSGPMGQSPMQRQNQAQPTRHLRPFGDRGRQWPRGPTAVGPAPAGRGTPPPAFESGRLEGDGPGSTTGSARSSAARGGRRRGPGARGQGGRRHMRPESPGEVAEPGSGARSTGGRGARRAEAMGGAAGPPPSAAPEHGQPHCAVGDGRGDSESPCQQDGRTDSEQAPDHI